MYMYCTFSLRKNHFYLKNISLYKKLVLITLSFHVPNIPNLQAYSFFNFYVQFGIFCLVNRPYAYHSL